MRSSRSRWMVGLAAIATIGMLYQTACVGFAGRQLMQSVDFCFLFDCQNGAFGGLVNPCAGTGVEEADEGVVTSTNLFIDCPPAEES